MAKRIRRKDTHELGEIDLPEEPAIEEKTVIVESAPQVPVDRTPRITMQTFLRGKPNDLGFAFRALEKRIRKQTRAEWESEWDAFLKAERR